MKLVVTPKGADATQLVFGRIDVSLPGDVIPVPSQDLVELRILGERTTIAELSARLERAFSGEPLECDGVDVDARPLRQPWHATAYPSDQNFLDPPWPFVLASPPELPVTADPRGLLAAMNSSVVYDGFNGVVESIGGISNFNGYLDARRRRFLVAIWDYRGRITSVALSQRRLNVTVEPERVSALQLLGSIKTNGGNVAVNAQSPGLVSQPILNALHVTLSLRHGAEDIDARTGMAKSFTTEELYIPPLSTPLRIRLGELLTRAAPKAAYNPYMERDIPPTPLLKGLDKLLRSQHGLTVLGTWLDPQTLCEQAEEDIVLITAAGCVDYLASLETTSERTMRPLLPTAYADELSRVLKAEAWPPDITAGLSSPIIQSILDKLRGVTKSSTIGAPPQHTEQTRYAAQVSPEPVAANHSLRFLHLTDLHCGMTGQKVLWSNVRGRFFDDLDRLRAKAGPWDLVVFTGDLTLAVRVAELYPLLRNSTLAGDWARAIQAVIGVCPATSIDSIRKAVWDYVDIAKRSARDLVHRPIWAAWMLGGTAAHRPDIVPTEKASPALFDLAEIEAGAVLQFAEFGSKLANAVDMIRAEQFVLRAWTRPSQNDDDDLVGEWILSLQPGEHASEALEERLLAALYNQDPLRRMRAYHIVRSRAESGAIRESTKRKTRQAALDFGVTDPHWYVRAAATRILGSFEPDSILTGALASLRADPMAPVRRASENCCKKLGI